MSTQQTHTKIPFSYSTPQTPFRLIELPQEILDGIEAPPSSSSPSQILYLKSSPNTHAVLCTDTKTYTLRQVQTSNSLYLLKPTTSTISSSTSTSTATISPPPPPPLHPSEEDDTDGSKQWDTALQEHSSIPTSSMTISGTATSYLELHPTVPLTHLEETITHVWKALNTLTGPGLGAFDVSAHDECHDGDLPPSGKGNGVGEGSFETVECDIPASAGEVLTAWREVGGVDFGRGKVGRLSPGYVLGLLKNLVVLAEGVLGRGDVFKANKGVGRVSDVVAALREGVMCDDDGESGEDRGKTLLEKVVRSVLARVAPEGTPEDDPTKEGKIDPKRYISTIGTLILQDHWEKSPKSTAYASSTFATQTYLTIPSFLEKWKEEVPLECLAAAGVEKLDLELLPPGRWRKPSALTIAWVEPGEAIMGASEEGGEKVGGVGGAAAAASKARGKWHEKFAAAKKRKMGGGP